MFRTYTSSFYGIESWLYKIKKKIFRTSFTYHKAVKNISFINICDSNPLACSNIRVVITFCHAYTKRMVNSVFSLFRSNCQFMNFLKYYFRCSPCFYRDDCRYFQCNLNVRNVADNILDVLKVRIEFDQKKEPILTDM